MGKSLRVYLRLLACYARVNLTGALEYRASFFMQAIGMALSNSTFIFFWWIVFSALQGRIGGYSFDDMMFVWAVNASAFGLAHVVFGNCTQISGIIQSGELDVFLLQPKNVLLSLLCSHTSLSAWGDLAYGVILMAITQSGAMAWLVFVLATLIGALLIAAIGVSAHTLTFFWGDASTLAGMIPEFTLNFSLYPPGIFPKVIKVLMYTVIPAGLVVHLPLTLLRQFRWELLLALLAGSLLYCALACLFFYKGLKRYASGNLIGARM